MIDYIIFGLVVGGVTFTTSVTSIMLFFRELLSKIHPKIDELVHCPWCSGFWLSLLMVIFSKNKFIEPFELDVLNIVFNAFVILSIAGLVHYVLLRSYEPVSKAMAMRHKEKEMAKRIKNFNSNEENIN